MYRYYKRKFEDEAGESIKLSTRGKHFKIVKPKSNKVSKALFQNSPVPASEVNRLKGAVGLSNAQGDKV